jgi:hypothetical protein
VVPHIVVPAAGLARRLPSGLGLALNPDGANSLPLYPESVSYLARLVSGAGKSTGTTAASIGVGHPPVEPRALLDETRVVLRELRFVRYASRAWLSVPGAGEGLVLSVALDDPASEARRVAVVHALERACAAVPLRVPFPVDVTFPGEILPGMTSPSPDVIDEWISRNTRPFYTRD